MHTHDEVFGLNEIDNPWSQMMADANSMGGGEKVRGEWAEPASELIASLSFHQ